MVYFNNVFILQLQALWRQRRIDFIPIKTKNQAPDVALVFLSIHLEKSLKLVVL